MAARRNADEFMRWVRGAHRVVTFVRAVTGDRDLAADHAIETRRAVKVRTAGERLVRNAAGCNGQQGCPCAVCDDNREGAS